MPVKIFFSYAHKDKECLNQLKQHLMSLVRIDSISLWSDQDINAGSLWENVIAQELNSSDIILLLVSPDFISSDYCYSVEMQRALELHRAGRAWVIPVILRDVAWANTPLGRLQALPANAQPISAWANQDEAFKNVVDGIQRVIDMQFQASTTTTGVPAFQTSGKTEAFVQYKRRNTLTSRIHGCDIHFTLSRSHFLQYTFEWEPFALLSPGSRFTLWLDGSNLVDRKKIDMSFIDVHFEVEERKGTIFCYHKGKAINVLIKLEGEILFEKNDTWDSVQ